jgi:hypothetical protein
VFTQKKNEKKVIRALDQVVHIYPERWRFVDNTPSSNWIFFSTQFLFQAICTTAPKGSECQESNPQIVSNWIECIKDWNREKSFSKRIIAPIFKD